MNKFIIFTLLISVGMVQASAHTFERCDFMGNRMPVINSAEITYCDISGLDQRAVLRALYFNAFVPQVGFFHPLVFEDHLSDQKCDELLDKMGRPYSSIDYVNGHRMKLYFLDREKRTLLFTKTYNDIAGCDKTGIDNRQLFSAEGMIAKVRVQADIVKCAGKPVKFADKAVSEKHSSMCDVIQQKLIYIFCRSKVKNA
ncbi:MAG: hypothetical protein P4L31_03095 [Candidatus Babeliales bacterium]|nr:hypothetical protein [Candidatus Babeliales bacterium]